jgi:ParB family chromosome partitioning protein
LSDKLGAKVQIAAGKKGRGKVTIEYASLDQLDGLLALLRQ